MENHLKIDWKTGLDITPEVFISSDNYHIADRNLLGHLLASNLYGVIPDETFYFEKRIDYDNVHISNLECVAVSKYGYIININSDNAFDKELDLSDADEDEHYVVLTVNPFVAIPSEYEEGFACPEYDLALKSKNDTIEEGIPILKIFRDGSYWGIDKDYIPPAMAINSVDKLIEKFNIIKNGISLIVDKLPEDYMFYAHTLLLQFQLNSFSMQETPQELIKILKQFCHIFKAFLKTTKDIDYLPDLNTFLEETYNHLEIGYLLQLGIKSLELINQKIDEKPAEVLEEIKI